MSTTDPLSEVKVASMAASTLDDDEITSFDDEDSSLAKFMRINFGPARDEVLAAHPWVFALTEDWVPKMGTAPKFGWKYQYQLPSDCMRPLPLRCEGIWNASPIPYERRGRRILTNEPGPLPLVYVRRETAMELWNPLVARVLAEYLAVLAAQRVTGKIQYLVKAQGLLKEAREIAVHNNTMDWGTPENQFRDDVHNVRLAG